MDSSDRLVGDLGVGSVRPIVNTHVHLPPNFSAFDTAEGAVALAASEGVSVIGASNYHDFRVYARLAAAASEAGVVPLFGLEIIALIEDLPGEGMLINDPTNLNRMYLCGKAITRFDPPIPAAARRMAAMRAASENRMRQMTLRIASRFGEAGLDGSLTDEQIAVSVGGRCGVPREWVSLQERHVAQAFQELLFRDVAPTERPAVLGQLFGAATAADPTNDVAVQEAIRSNLMKAGKPAFVPEAAVSFDDAYRLILELGGIPCYPILADGTSPICAFEDSPELLADRLLSRGIHAAELIPGRNRPEIVDNYVAALRGAGIVVVAGTEHNTKRMVPLEPAALGGAAISEAALEAFWEGACVVAAHQQLSASGQLGYVDGDGRPTPGYKDGESRIRSLRRIGADFITSHSAPRVQA